jgi:hypothetical protein
MGAHQKIDRLSRGALRLLLKDTDSKFPSQHQILHFEGVNGPDAIKRKSPAHDEPWHYYAPFDETDTQLVQLIGDHYDHLVHALKKEDDVRAAFEASWLAHAIVDGLTPAHHFPYEEKLAELRGGKGLETRNSVKTKIVMPGGSAAEKMSNNWKMWGPRGLLMSHGFFEFGIAFLIKPISTRQVAVRPQDLAELQKYGMMELFRRKAKEVSAQGMYDYYQERGWTPRLAWRVRTKLVPVVVHTVALAWYAAAVDAGIVSRPKMLVEQKK